MSGGVIVELLVVQVVLILLLFVILIYIVKVRHNIALENKFSKYTIPRLENKEISIFDKISSLIGNVIKRVSSVIEKSVFLKKYGSTYEKHISYDELEVRRGIDYISVKLLLGFVTLILYLITMMFQYVRVSFIGLILSYVLGFFIIDSLLYWVAKLRLW